MKKLLQLLLIATPLCSSCIALAQVAPAAQAVVGKTICGYQAWFNAFGDGSPVARWRHWSAGQYQSNNGVPAPGAITFEAYPDVTEYGSGQLFQTSLGNLNNGQPAKLFSSWYYDVIDLHFKWMQDNGIDGAALQRFLGETRDGVFRTNRDSIAKRMRRAAEKYQRIFYIMYDMSADDTAYFKSDWTHIENDLNVVSSPYYAHQDGKPVICIWGFGLTGRPNAPANSLAIINWLKAKGYYVIGGVPTYWRTGVNDTYAGYSAVFDAFDMISPWTVGRFNSIAGADNFKNNLIVPDLAYCNTHNIDYQPVIFSGFAWSNWNGGPVNEISRNKGEFFWRQLYNIKNLGLNTAYIAMFDEYDEGTNIMKMADSYFAVPNNQYFLTSSADGTYIGSDFYLRLAGRATQVLKGTQPLTTNVTIPYSVAPLWFRTSVETGYDAVLNWTNSADPSSVPRNVSAPLCGIVSGETSHTGPSSIRVSGTDNAASGGSYYYFRAFDVDIPVNASTKLSFWTFPTNSLSRYVTVDLVMTDGTTLRDIGATDQNGASMHPGAGHGTVNTWNKIFCNIGNWLNGKTIDRIMIAYDHGAETGNFKTYFDDIIISDTITVASPLKAAAVPALTDRTLSGKKGALSGLIQVYPQPANNTAVIKFRNGWKGTGFVTVLTANGTPVGRQVISIENGQASLPVSELPAGMYFLRVNKGGESVTQQLVVVH
ncbi:T9SS type A sorting domain-containing protein [Chitinophaga agrisoli]|uniref:T9SS type A sorting domain-containing protein n=2 Tax=Chitinophaga agrisoli TaxID=2607653 RepID=A0A5B2VRU0_9BACT|nr:T9SS type A sorting domain-containing protein [Chitinophaga agrisoli]